MMQIDQWMKLTEWLKTHKPTHPRYARKARTLRRLEERMDK